MKVYTNQTNLLVGSTAVMEHKDKDQVAFELAKSFILCGPQAYSLHQKLNSVRPRR
jgi:hypothetical protein